VRVKHPYNALGGAYIILFLWRQTLLLRYKRRKRGQVVDLSFSSICVCLFGFSIVSNSSTNDENFLFEICISSASNYILLQGHFPGILKPKIKAMSSVIHKIVVPSNIDIVIQAMNGPYH
jgi:hypothetical protein